ncbi:MAG: hypothetical protein J5613_01820 [Alphaproteobacteria bacterium]|nr:hypothetical protein [Alphaproteobacteria bacterium]MBR4806422.1 hypothetical protein [Alphaproteobacteria bacterium]
MRILAIISLLSLTACNSVYMHPGTMEPGTVVHAKYGGYSMKRAVKEALEKRGYDVRVGKLRKVYGDDNDKESLELPGNTKYVVRVSERKELFMPYWCLFNGFWWWRFSVSVTDQHDGKEILSWRGRGCQNSSLRKLDDILNELEKK